MPLLLKHNYGEGVSWQLLDVRTLKILFQCCFLASLAAVVSFSTYNLWIIFFPVALAIFPFDFAVEF